MHADQAFELEPVTAEAAFEDSLRNNRDPRKDPQPGDVLAIGTDVREVWERIALHGPDKPTTVQYGFPGKSATRYMRIDMWRVWARNAEVKKVAP